MYSGLSVSSSIGARLLRQDHILNVNRRLIATRLVPSALLSLTTKSLEWTSVMRLIVDNRIKRFFSSKWV